MNKYLFEFEIKNEYVVKFKDELNQLKLKSIKENGCILFDFFMNKNIFIILEYWEKESDFLNHLQTNDLLDFRQKTKEFLINKRKKFDIIESEKQ